MKIDLAMHLHHTSGLVDRKRQLDQVSEMHWHLALMKEAKQAKDLIGKKSAKFLQQDYATVIQR